MNQEGNMEFLTKYCKIMVSKLQNSEDVNRMMTWLEAVTSEKCDKGTSLMYLELMLWALHTDRINVFPFKYFPPVDHGEITDAYDYALDIVKLEPEKNYNENSGEVKTVVTDNLKEFLAVQEVDGFGSQCYYAFSDKAPVSCWTMPPDINLPAQNDLCKEPKYWMTLFSRPKFSKIETQKLGEEQQNEICEEEEAADDKSSDTSEKTICPDLSKVEYILNNLSFGGKKPQDVRTLADQDDSACNGNNKSHSSADPKATDESSLSNPQEPVETVVLNVDYSPNHFGDLSNSKKYGKPRKNINHKSREGQITRRRSNCSSNADDLEMFNGHFPRKRKEKKPISTENNLKKVSRPEDSILALCSDSFFNDSRQKKQYKQNSGYRSAPSNYKDNYVFSPSSSLPGSSPSYRNREAKWASSDKPNIKNNNKYRRDSCNVREKQPILEDIFKEASNYIIPSRDDFKSSTSNNYNYLNKHERNPALPSRGKYDEGYLNYSRDLLHIEAYDEEGYQDPVYEEIFTQTRSERKLQFSEIHAEPQRHKPRLSADAPLKPCLRKLSDVTQATELSDYYNPPRTHREFKRDPQFCYFSQPPSKLNQRSKQPCSSSGKRTQYKDLKNDN